jgi:hypothetical protein
MEFDMADELFDVLGQLVMFCEILRGFSVFFTYETSRKTS